MTKKINNNNCSEEKVNEEKLGLYIQKLIGKKPQDLNAYAQALTHKSVDNDTNYEKLEFLGDRVLGFIISEFVHNNSFWKDYDVTVKDLHNCFASFTYEDAQAAIYNDLKLSSFIRYKGQNSLSNKLKADFLEALIGAIYLDKGITRGITVVRKALSKIFLDECNKLNAPMFITPQEKEFRNRLKKKRIELVIEHKQDKKDWVLRSTINSTINNKTIITTIEIRDPNIVVARKLLLDDLIKIMN